MNSRINSIFMSVLFMCVSSQNTVLAVFETERNMFYRHRNAKMYGTGAIVRAFTFAEIPFILMSSTAFTLIFYFFLGYVVFLYTDFPSSPAHFLIPFTSFKNQICKGSGQILFVLLVCYFGIRVLYYDRANVSSAFPRQSNCSGIRRTLHQYDIPVFWYFDSSEQYTVVLDLFVSRSFLFQNLYLMSNR